MRKHFFTALFFLSFFLPNEGNSQAPVKQTGDFIENYNYNSDFRGASRTLQYTPDGEDFVCVNGKNRYTRALYGGHTEFRIETSDRPVFAAFAKNKSQHFTFRITVPGAKAVSLDSINYCEARYTPGRRSYQLTDPAWGKGELKITVLARMDMEGGIWKIESKNMPSGTSLWCGMTKIRNSKLSRNGDMGADPANSFEAPLQPEYTSICNPDMSGNKSAYVLFDLDELKLSELSNKDGEKIYTQAEKDRSDLASRVHFITPDPYINTLGGAIVVAADGTWDGETWMHGAIGWRMPLTGWRAGYIGDFLGWPDRARTHFNAFAESQVTEVPNTIPHPAQDMELNMARSEKKWGTPHYSNGYICRNPHKNNQMHHYDMNLCYIDELLWHFNWTGDLEYARKMWPVLKLHLAWEKLNFDPDNDGLYDAYACIWASDGLYYNSGAVTHSSAYNYRSNKMAAEIAEKIGEDPTPYRNEAEKILKAINARLWMKEQGHWAEFQDFMGKKRLHESAAVWTIYHAIDSEVGDPFQNYQATRYVDTEIPHIPVVGKGLKDEGYEVVATTNWMPYAWSINNVAGAEIMHTSLAYFLAGRHDEGFKLLKSSILDNMYLGNSPGNFGQVSFYDAARGECYRDFSDPVGVASRAFIQGLYGINPDLMNNRLAIRPGFPTDWSYASLQTSYISFGYKKNDKASKGAAYEDVYTIKHQFSRTLNVDLQIPARMDKIIRVTVNGKTVKWKQSDAVVGYPLVSIEIPSLKDKETCEVKIEWGGSPIIIPEVTGNRTTFTQVTQGEMTWWKPVHHSVAYKEPQSPGTFAHVVGSQCEPVDMDKVWNASVTDIYKNNYLTPRSPYTTLQIPTQGIGEWCHPKLTADIDDSGLRAKVQDNIFRTGIGVPFRTPVAGNNIAYTSLWDNYPDSVSVGLSGKASRIYLLMAGSTNQMQCRITNGQVKIQYTDGSVKLFDLINPETWCPIEQDFFIDGKAFRLDVPRAYRLHLKSGLVSNNLEKDLRIKDVYGREIDGGAAIMLDIDLDASKELKQLTVETLSNDVVIGLMSVTLQR